MSELYEHTKEAEATGALFSEELFATDLTFDVKDKLENLGCAYAESREQCGFINGFRLGMKLAEEILRGVVAEKSAISADLHGNKKVLSKSRTPAKDTTGGKPTQKYNPGSQSNGVVR